MIPATALEVIQLFFESEGSANGPRLADNLKTVFRRYILPELGFASESLRENFQDCLSKVPVRQFQKIEETFDKALESQKDERKKLSDGSVRNYRSALSRLLNWLKSQSWYVEASQPASEDYAPVMSVGKSISKCAEDTRQANEKFTHLNPQAFKSFLIPQDQLSPGLSEQLNQLHLFWTEPDSCYRRGPSIEVQAVEKCIVFIRIFLGWLKVEKQIPDEELNLALLTSFETLNEFLDWGIKEHDQGYPWASDVAKVILLVLKWMNPQSKHYTYSDIPQIVHMRRYIFDLDAKREDIGHYGLKPEDLSDKTRAQLDAFRRFWLDLEVPERKKPPVVEQTWKGYNNLILWFLGWLHNIQGEPIETLSLEQVANLDLLKKFVAWSINVRGNGYGWATNAGYASLAVAKWLNPQSKHREFRDIPVVEEIRDYTSYLREQHRNEDSRQNIDKKMLTFQEAQLVVDYLKQCCAPLDKYGDARSEKAVMSSWQKYLIVAILTYCPVRQREIRELTIDGTLCREADGYWVKLKPSQHKAGRRSRKGREYALPKHLTKDLDTWLRDWRVKGPNSHQFVFMRMRSNRFPETFGDPLNAGNMSDLVTSAVHNATAVLFGQPRDTTPHIYRRIAVTYQHRYGRPEQRDALAELMGHSLAEAIRTYNEESSRERTQRADRWWELKEEPGSGQQETLPVQPLINGQIAEDQHELRHLSASAHQNEYLKKKRDQALLSVWAMQELAWREIPRCNIGDFITEGESYKLKVSKPDGTRYKEVIIKDAIAKILLKYLEARKECGEKVDELSPLFIGIGNRSRGGRLDRVGIQGILKFHLGEV